MGGVLPQSAVRAACLTTDRINKIGATRALYWDASPKAKASKHQTIRSISRLEGWRARSKMVASLARCPLVQAEAKSVVCRARTACIGVAGVQAKSESDASLRRRRSFLCSSHTGNNLSQRTEMRTSCSTRAAITRLEDGPTRLGRFLRGMPIGARRGRIGGVQGEKDAAAASVRREANELASRPTPANSSSSSKK